MSTTNEVAELTNREYQAGFVTDIESDSVPPGLSEDIIRLISAKKNEPEFLLEWRLKAYRHWLTMTEPTWANVHYPPDRLPEHRLLLGAQAEEGRPQEPRRGRSRSCSRPTRSWASRCTSGSGWPASRWTRSSTASRVATTFKEKLGEVGVIFCSFSEAVQEHPELVQKYLGSVVPYTDNFFAALNSAVFTDGSFCYIPKGVRCPMELSTYFRINAANTGQFERTLIVAEEGAYVSYLEGCTAPIRDENQLHAAVVELVALDDAQIKYSTVQNWYPGDKDGKGGIYNFVTKRGKCAGARLEDLLDPGGDRLGHHLEVPELHPAGRQLGGRVLLGGGDQQLPAGRHRHQDDPHRQEHARAPSSRRASPPATARTPTAAWCKIGKGADGARNYSQCDSLLLGDKCGAHTFPYIDVQNSTAQMEHEASTSKIGEDQLFYFQSARHLRRGRRQHDRQRLLQGSLQGAAHGVRGGSAEAPRRQPRRQRR